ncbi:unnamed protein product [Chrysoparadoxa australica]
MDCSIPAPFAGLSGSASPKHCSQPILLEQLEGHEGVVTAVKFLAYDGKAVLLSSSLDGSVRVWRVEPRRTRSEGRTRKEGRVLRGGVYPPLAGITCLAVCQGEGTAITGCEDGKMRMWDLESGNCTVTHSTHTSSSGGVTAVGLGATRIAIASGDKMLRVFLRGSMTEVISTTSGGGHSSVDDVAMFGKRAGKDQAVEESEGSQSDSETDLVSVVAVGGSHGIESTTSSSPDTSGRRFGSAIMYHETSEAIEAPVEESLAKRKQPFDTALNCVDCTPSGNRVVFGAHSPDCGVYLAEPQGLGKKKCKADGFVQLGTHPAGVSSVAISGDGKWAVSGDRSRCINVHALGASLSGCHRVAYTINKAHQGVVKTLDISPDLKTLYSGGCDRKIKIWDLAVIVFQRRLCLVYLRTLWLAGRCCPVNVNQSRSSEWQARRKTKLVVRNILEMPDKIFHHVVKYL